MSKVSNKQIVCGMALVWGWIWVVAYLVHVLPSDWRDMWWAPPMVLSLVIVGIVIYYLGTLVPFKDKSEEGENE